MQQLSLWDYKPPIRIPYHKMVILLVLFTMAFSPPVPQAKAISGSFARPEPVLFVLPLPDAKPITSPKEAPETDIKPILPGDADPFDLIDVERTYRQLSELLGRNPTPEEIAYMTLSTEFWGLVYRNNNMIILGTEAYTRARVHFCGIDGCDEAELFKFLSGYQVWFGRHAVVDEDTFRLAEHLYNMLVSQQQYENANGPHLKKISARVVDAEYIISKGWDTGLRYDRPWQWFGPFPTGGNVDALSCTKLGEGQRFCFFTYAQTQKFNP